MICSALGVLRQHQVGGFMVQHGDLNVEGAFIRNTQRAHPGLHLGATEYGSINETPAYHRFVPGFGWVVTEVADPDQLIAEAQSIHNLRPTGE